MAYWNAVTVGRSALSAFFLLAGCIISGTNAPLSPASIEVLWVLTPATYLSCSDQAYSLRRVQRTFGDQVDVIAIPVGLSPDNVDSVVQQERIEARVASHSERASYESLVGRTLRPAVHVISQNRVIASWDVGDPALNTKIVTTIADRLP